MEAGDPIAPLLQGHGLLDFPCGIGKCGKCLIHANTTPCDEEISKLGQAAIDSGLRLGCHTRAQEGVEITLPNKSSLCVLSSFARKAYDFTPAISKKRFELSPSPGDFPETDMERLLRGSHVRRHGLTLQQQARLPYFLKDLKETSKQGYALVQDDTLLGFSCSKDHHALIVDIGTTTVAATLVDLYGQNVVGVKGEHNAQYPYGADVVSRIKHTIDKGTSFVQKAIIGQIDQILHALLNEADLDDVSMICFAGNTTMMHMVCGLPGEFIGKAPFRPITTQPMRLNAGELGISSAAPAFLMPGISSYIGADIVASLLAVEAHQATEPFLLIDFGTNAETVLFANNTFYCCSAAAGPCFEGVTLACGMPGQAGAIDTVDQTDSGLGFTVMENIAPRGICGSGVLDAVALLLELNVLDETGALSADSSGPLADRLDATKGLMFTDSVYLTQKDIREVQLAKAAIRAGIEILFRQANISPDAIDTFYLAGGFGSALRAESAVRIGLIPQALLPRISVLGNAAGFGALRYVTEKNARDHAQSIIDRTEYIELSALPSFSEYYVDHMFFPGGQPMLQEKAFLPGQ